ncbi:MAG: DUF6062 family protein [Lachnospiraceae bacterium]|nr:DUF6062 family protein [Lachnospiraceae bacterium]
MKEKLYTIPLNDAFHENDECPFCYIEKKIEEDLLDFVLGSGSSYMESDIRETTDKEGFCRYHFQKMFNYGNTLGNAWILKTHYEKMRNEMQEQIKKFQPRKVGFKEKLNNGLLNKSTAGKESARLNSMAHWTDEVTHSCYICKRYAETYERYLDTFFVMYRKDPDFVSMVQQSKGFCLPHFGDLCEMADGKLSDREKADFYPAIFQLMTKHMDRLQEDVSWLVEKFDYRNRDADWKTSRDAIQRGMQKLAGGYPAAPVYQSSK